MAGSLPFDSAPIGGEPRQRLRSRRARPTWRRGRGLRPVGDAAVGPGYRDRAAPEGRAKARRCTQQGVCRRRLGDDPAPPAPAVIGPRSGTPQGTPEPRRPSARDHGAPQRTAMNHAISRLRNPAPHTGWTEHTSATPVMHSQVIIYTDIDTGKYAALKARRPRIALMPKDQSFVIHSDRASERG